MCALEHHLDHVWHWTVALRMCVGLSTLLTVRFSPVKSQLHTTIPFLCVERQYWNVGGKSTWILTVSSISGISNWSYEWVTVLNSLLRSSLACLRCTDKVHFSLRIYSIAEVPHVVSFTCTLPLLLSVSLCTELFNGVSWFYWLFFVWTINGGILCGLSMEVNLKRKRYLLQ